MSDTPTQIDDGGQAFPRTEDDTYCGEFGMTLRDYYAGQALAGIHAHPESTHDSYERLAEIAYHQADAMIAERNRTK